MTEPDDLRHLQHPRFARNFAGLSAQADRRGGADHRQRLLTGLHGTVLELGAGNGRNFPHYPAEVTRVLAVEPDATMRELARPAAETAPVPVEIITGRAEALPTVGASVDAVVASLVLCTVPDLPRTLAEIHLVLKPGGQLRFYEHIRSDGIRGLAQDVVRPLWSWGLGGCNPNRRTMDAITSAGFVVDEQQQFRWRMVPLSPALDYALGTAHRD